MTEIKSFDRVADVYDETRGLPPDVASAIADGIVGALRERGPSPLLLEVGIGTGRMAVPLAERGVRITGIDISPKMLRTLLGKRDDIDVMLAEAARPPLRERSFDAALFVHILHLVPDAEATVRATLPLLRPGALVVHGSDAPREGIRDEAELIIRNTVNDVTGIDLTGWKPYEDSDTLLGRVLGGAGAVVAHTDTIVWSATVTAKRMIERLARKDFSSSWLIPDDAMPGILAGVEPRLVALFEGFDAPAEYQRSFVYTAWRLA